MAFDLIKEYYVPYMSNDNNYPRVFMTQEDLDKIAHIEADMNDYIYRKRAEWIVNGNIDTEWDDYKKELENTDFLITSLLNKNTTTNTKQTKTRG